MNTFTTEERHALVLNHISLAKKIAYSKKKKLSHISLEELTSAAYLGLVEAANNYDPIKNDCFSAFAVWRIIGAVRDYLRELAWGSRSKPLKALEIEDETYFVYNEISYMPYFEDLIVNLNAINKTVLRLYYQEGLKIKQIADKIGVHQSRISQILSESRLQLEKFWNRQKDELSFMAA